jgi:hypothetical protein
LTAVKLDDPAKGTLSLAADGSFTYTPEEGATGSDTFTYRAFDPQQAGSTPVAVTITLVPGEVHITTCRPVMPAVVHRDPNTCGDNSNLGDPFLVNRRLAPIENGTVPCVEVDTMEVTRCVFRTGLEFSGVSRIAAPPPSGPWLEDGEGRHYAVVGQPVTRDGLPASGAFVVGTVPGPDNGVPCVGATGRDAASETAGTDANVDGVLETLGAETNAVTVDEDGLPYRLVNHATEYVGTTSVPHPDGVAPMAVDEVRGIAWYTGRGAALNDPNGSERNENGIYYPARTRSHYVMVGGVMVPAAKRPSTRSYPAPGVYDVHSRIRWLPASPYVTIANVATVGPHGLPPPRAVFKASVGLNTLWLDASDSTGDIVGYRWDLDWTAGSDGAVKTPATSFPLAFEGPAPPTSGWVTLTVVARDGQRASASQQVDFQTRIREFPRRKIPGPN